MSFMCMYVATAISKNFVCGNFHHGILQIGVDLQLLLLVTTNGMQSTIKLYMCYMMTTIHCMGSSQIQYVM